MKTHWNRLLSINKEEAIRLKNELKYVKNSIESKRINLMIVYLSTNISWNKVWDMLKISHWTVSNTIKEYIKDPEKFYKTNFTGKRRTKDSNRNPFPF